jgi:hypothetical protein
MADAQPGVLVPAWLGPDKLFNTAKGKSYVFGLFKLTPDRIAFASDGATSIDVRRQEIVVEWPRLLGGGACRLRTPGGSWIIAFGRPFPDAPAPDQEKIEQAAEALEALHESAEKVSDWAGLGASVLKDLVVLAQALNDLKKGRRTADVVKAALAEKNA